MKNNNIVILDNGAGSIKAGTATGHHASVRLVPNAIVRSKGDKTTYVGHEMDKCKDYTSLHYRLPFEKGYVVDWDAQKAIWDGIFSDQVLDINTTESSLILTEPYFNLPNIQQVYDQFIFEEYEFVSYHRSASLIPYGNLFEAPGLPPPDCMIIIDSGFSSTHVVPILNRKIIWTAVKRLDVGGKLLTNKLKELISFRQWNMMDETYIMNDVKQSCCYVSPNFANDMESIRSGPVPIVQRYVLPDMSANRKGRILDPGDVALDSEQVLLMKNERFSVPEIIFRPDDIGLNQSGLAATIAVAISCLPQDLQPMFWENLGLIGGNTKFPGFRERLLSELQSLAPMDCKVAIYESDDPITEAYQSAQMLASRPDFSTRCITRAEYLESGSNASRRKFPDWKLLHGDGDDEASMDTRTNIHDEEEEEEEEEEVTVVRPQQPVLKRTRGRPRGGGTSFASRTQGR